MTLAQRVIEAARQQQLTVAVAESLTAGMVCARLADVPGASAVLRGGVVSYATDLKASLLGVDDALLAAHGPVHAQVAAQMATGVRDRLQADIGLATTGVAGPGPSDGHPAGTVYLGLHHPGEITTRRLTLQGDRMAIRQGCVDELLGELLQHLSGTTSHPGALPSA